MTPVTPAPTFPRQYSRTLRYTLGAPRSFALSPDGSRVAFLRTRGGTERANLLWVLDLPGDAAPDGGSAAAPAERVAADPAALLDSGGESLTDAERARRERSREGSAGVVGYATDAAVTLAAFVLSGRLFTAGLTPGGTARELPAAGPLLDPRPSPDGRHIGYATVDGELRVIAADGTGDRALAAPEESERGRVSWGQAEFIAQEEMSRFRGFWWAPDGERMLAARVDESPVQRWWIADPANPSRPPREVAYPAAGTPNAEVGLYVLGLDGSRAEVKWDRGRFPYLARVHWSAGGPPLLLVQTRDQRAQRYLAVDPDTGSTSTVLDEEDPVWLELFSGVPAWTGDGRLVRIADLPDSGGGADGGAGVRALVVGDAVRTGPELHVRAVLDIGDTDVLITASAGPAAEAAGRPETGEVHVYRVPLDPDGGPAVRLSGRPGHHGAVRNGGPVRVLLSAALDRPGTEAAVWRDDRPLAEIASLAEPPVITAAPLIGRASPRGIPSAVLLPTGYDPARDGRLPVLMNPYGGPHGQMVVASHNAHLTSQWFADQGFAVVVADGRGTPGHSPDWEKSVARDFAGATLDDQVAALQALAEDHPLDLGRVGIRGWSYGGYLAALAVLRRPDVFHAAVAGAPVTDWELYDTHYTERYLGHPVTEEVYRANSLLADAPRLERPLMLIHGLADDNVVAAHTLRLSSHLLAAGRPHEVLPLSGVTHMTPQEEVAENLLLLQVDFLRRALGV
ncbi:prolyl oligopeptidase family serine peptidase [Phaeacidiphilus oryzae]|uniref:prolyl oligopeptidase family serine peptidase n=1 Tax=Phaeacidiphilus oryzae TaxID=348818 RepID=UPI00056191EF|nr:prolyl oligopeptidase family serine peptidase [Phaeacidiphilus oryzae]